LGTTKLQDVQAASLISNEIPQVNVRAILCWSEYFNGKWQLTRTSDVNHPLGLGRFDAFGAGAFDRSKLKLSVMFWTRGAMRIIVSNEIGTGSSFFLYNTHSAPELREGEKAGHFAPKRTLETTTSALKVGYSAVSHIILNNDINDHTIEPNHPLQGDPWDTPFFYEDNRHVFYVTTSERIILIPNWLDFVVTVKPKISDITIPPLVVEPVRVIPDPIGPVSKQPGFGVFNPAPIEHVISEDAYIRRGIGTYGTVRYGEKEIGPAGSQLRSMRKR
jgi:hypothetical protein